MDEKGTSPYRGETVRVNHDTPHGGVVGSGGAMFFSVQYWLNEVTPHCVALDWDGYTASQEQLDKLKFGNASYIKQKTEDMAASLE